MTRVLSVALRGSQSKSLTERWSQRGVCVEPVPLSRAEGGRGRALLQGGTVFTCPPRSHSGGQLPGFLSRLPPPVGAVAAMARASLSLSLGEGSRCWRRMDLAHRERAGPRPRCRCRQRCCLWPGWPGWPGRSVSRKSCAARMARQSPTLQSPLEGQSSQALVHGSARSWDNVFVSLCLPLCFPHSFDFRTF